LPQIIVAFSESPRCFCTNIYDRQMRAKRSKMHNFIISTH
jgi:hypothetical protein